ITRLDRGGPPRLLLRLAEETRKKGFDVVIVSGPSKEPEKDMERFTERTGIPVRIVPQLVRDVSPLKDILALFSLIHIIRKESPSIIHTHTSKAGFLGRVAGRVCGVRCIVHTPHGHIFYGYYGRIKTRLFIVLERIASCFCDRITTLTELEKEDYIRLKVAREDKLIPIYCGVDLGDFTEEGLLDIRDELKLAPDRSIQGLDKGTKLIGWVGRLEEVKGCFVFLEACRLIKEEFPEVKFLLAGDGPLRKEIEDWAEVHLKGSLLLLGHRTDIPKIMRGIDIFVLTSLNEGFGLVLVEAMAAGKPVVATNVGGVSEIVLDGETGLLVPAGGSEGVARAVETLLSNPALALGLGKKGKERAQLFDIERMTDKTINLYRELMGC
ncbi:MAG: glycosyltransferase family 4 protein, partial [Deltaproteobacteria bacterium]|nr:glycosyltransferase family 4 protein [Deltaproteobacteria bacterium]